jgi:Zn-dependent protease with chaperone function
MSEYVPKPDIEGINVTKDHGPLKDGLILLAGFFTIVSLSYFALIHLSDWFLSKITLKQEMSWLKQLTPILKLQEHHSKDLTSLMSKLKPHVPFDINVEVICSSDINAFAYPGGKIFLTKALLENIKSENGLVFVIGHEVGHILNRDHLRGMGRQLIFSLGKSLLGFQDVAGGAMLNQMLERVYDRKQEEDADENGLELVKKVYGHTWGSDELFELLEKTENKFLVNMTRLSSTHPPSVDRREKLKFTQSGEAKTLTFPARAFKDWLSDFGCP